MVHMIQQQPIKPYVQTQAKTDRSNEEKTSNNTDSSLLMQNYELLWVKTDKIMPNPAQPRTVFDAEALNDLAESIKKYGILQPLSIRSNPDKSKFSHFQYELVAGERRLRAAKLLGMEQVPCILIESDTKTSAALAIIENLHRKDLNIFEEASAIAALIDIYHLTQEQIAAQLSLTQAAVANKLRLLRLSEDEKALILSNNLTERHARALLRIKNPSLRLAILAHIIRHNLNVTQSEAYIATKLPDVLVRSKAEEKAENRPSALNKGYKNLIRNIEKAIESTRNHGGNVKTQQTETDSDIIYTISIPKV